MMSWSYSYSSEVLPAVITLFMIIYLGAYSWERRDLPAAKVFTVACALGCFWTIGVILEILAVNYSDKIFWVKYQLVWQLPVGATMTCFVLEYAGLGRWLTLRNCLFLFLVPLLSVLLILTNDMHHLIWTGFYMNRYVIESHGGLYWIFNFYVYLLGIFNFVLLVRLGIYSPGHRLAVVIIMLGQIIARIGYTLDKVDTDLFGPGESAFFIIGVVSISYAFAFLRFNAIDPIAAARKAVLDQMIEGLFVIDMQGRIIYVNPMAAAMTGVPAQRLQQRLFAEVLPVDAGFLEQMENQKISQTDVALGRDESARQYNLLLTPLRGRKNEAVGKMLLLRDVTEQWRAQNRIVEQQRTVAKLQEREHLARELHDGIGQILGYVSVQVQAALKWFQNGKADKAGKVLGRIAEVTKDAHADIRESILMLRSGLEKKKSFISNLKNYLERFQANFGIRTELSVPTDIDEDTFDSEVEAQLMRVIQEALTNSRKHSGGKTLKVCVELDTSKAFVTVTDHGKGFDTSRLGSSDDGHFGLMFMRERMAHIGGSLTIESTPNVGTVLKLEVPVRSKEDTLQ